MPDRGPLIVPIEVAALKVNDLVRRTNFQRWTMNYQAIGDFESVEPAPFGGASDFSSNLANDGVYLHWTLPESLRNGVHDLARNRTTFPIVPNRWLVVRWSGPPGARTATSWVVESDFADANAGTSAYLDPWANQPTPTAIGRKIALTSQGYQDPGGGRGFLTAVAPGLPTFAAYQPYNEDVFSIHDPLAGVAATDTLSYLVVGWYSRAADDVLTAGDFAKLLDDYRWAISDAHATAGDTATRSLFCGRVAGLKWDANGAASPGRPDPTKVKIAVGNTSIDAVTALVEQQAASDPAIDPQVLEAFQYGLLGLMDEPDAQVELARSVHDAAFGVTPGDYSWQITDRPGAEGDPPTAAELATEEAWLVKLNAAQRAYKEAAGELAAKQWQLYAYWWLNGVASGLPQPPSGVDLNQLAAQLDSQNKDGLAADVATRQQQLVSLAATVPCGATQADLQDAISTCQQQHSLPANRQLKRVVRNPFRAAADPVVLLTGTGASSILRSVEALPCRFPAEFVSALPWSGGTVSGSLVAGVVPMPSATGLPAEVPAVLLEHFLLDPANAQMVASALGHTDPATIKELGDAMASPTAAAGQALPALGLELWTQPWSPLYLLWSVDYHPIAHDDDGAPTWTFDGTRFTWTGAGAQPAITLSGRIMLTPQAVFNLQAQIVRYAAQHPDPELAGVSEFLTNTDHWDVLSQTLDGLSRALTLRDASARVGPSDEIATLIGNQTLAAPAAGTPWVQPGKGWPPSQFQPYRSGQFAFNLLTVVDRFGQGLEVVTAQTSSQTAPVVADGLRPGPNGTVEAYAPYRFVELPPRPLQPGRLEFELLDAVDDAKVVGLDVGANPVCGWILPNHLDSSLFVYDSLGAPLGELRVVTDSSGARVPWWTQLPGSRYAGIDALRQDYPHLWSTLARFKNQTAQAAADLTTLRQLIDDTLPLIDPLTAAGDNVLAALAGLPLALVRARILLELADPPLLDPSWRFVLQDQTPAFPGFGFPIRLGDLGCLGDGLVGYFADDRYDKLNAVYAPSGSTSYAAAIGASGNYLTLNFGTASSSLLTLLIDPRAPVHAVSDILPTVELALPSAFVTSPLNAIEVMFRVGPVLATTRPPSPDHKDQLPSVVVPRPSERKGTWTWEQYDGTSWNGAPVTAADALAILPATVGTRSGFLKLSGAEGR